MSHFSVTSIASRTSVWKELKFTALKELLPSVFPRFKQGWSALICITEDYRFQWFVSYPFSALCVCPGQPIRVPQKSSEEQRGPPGPGSSPWCLSRWACLAVTEGLLGFAGELRQCQDRSFSPLPPSSLARTVPWSGGEKPPFAC